MIGTASKDYYYAARVYKQKALEKQIEDDIKTMVYTLLNRDKRRLRTENADNVIKASGEPLKQFDGYSGCKHWEKKFCPANGKKWAGYIEEWDEDDRVWRSPYVLLADSELGIYLQVIDFYIGKRSVYPGVL